MKKSVKPLSNLSQSLEDDNLNVRPSYLKNSESSKQKESVVQNIHIFHRLKDN